MPPLRTIRSLLCWLGAALAATAPVARAATPTYSLAECLDLAVKQNPEVEIAAKRVEAARAAVTVAKGPLFPSLTSNGSYQHLEESYATSGGANITRRPEDYQITNRLTQSLYSGGLVRARIAAAKLALQSESLNYLTALDTAALAVRVAFSQTLFAEASIGVREQAVDILGRQLKDQRDRLNAGSVSQLNVNRAEVTLANEKPALDMARYEMRAAYITLAQTLGYQYPDNATGTPFHIRGSLEYRGMPGTLNECLIRAGELRPEIQARKFELDALNQQVSIEKTGTRPQINAFAGYDLFSETSRFSEKDSFSGYTIGFNGSWLIFDGFATLGRVRAARARVGGGAAALVAIRQQVEAEVRTAFYQLQQAEATLRPQAENIHLAQETLDISTSNFGAGLSTQLDLLQSRVDLTRAQTNELAARLACNQARARLDRAMGVGRPTVSGDGKDAAAPAK